MQLINITRYLYSDKYSLKLNKFEAENSGVLIAIYYTLNSLTLSWLGESIQWIFEVSARDVITTDYTIIMSRTLKVTGLSCHVWLQSMISKGNHDNFAPFVLLAVSEEAKTWLPSFFVQCIIERLDSVFVMISRISGYHKI